MAREIGTLRELNVQPGDVVEFIYGGSDNPTAKEQFESGTIQGNLSVMIKGHGVFTHDSDAIFHILSRTYSFELPHGHAKLVPSGELVDLTTIATPLGLLDEVYGTGTQDALRAHGGPYEMFSRDGWSNAGGAHNRWRSDVVFRVKAVPKLENITVDRLMFDDGDICDDQTPIGQPVRVTFTRKDGRIDPATYRVEARK